MNGAILRAARKSPFGLVEPDPKGPKSCDLICGNCASWTGWGVMGGVGDCARESELTEEERYRVRSLPIMAKAGGWPCSGPQSVGIGWNTDACRLFGERKVQRRVLLEDMEPRDHAERLKPPPPAFDGQTVPVYAIEISYPDQRPEGLRHYAEVSPWGNWVTRGDHGRAIAALERDIRDRDARIEALQRDIERLRAERSEG